MLPLTVAIAWALTVVKFYECQYGETLGVSADIVGTSLRMIVVTTGRAALLAIARCSLILGRNAFAMGVTNTWTVKRERRLDQG